MIGRRVHSPAEERHPHPVHARRPHRVDRDQEVQACQDRGEPGEENADGRHDDPAVRVDRRVRRIEGPARVDAAMDDRPHGDETADDVEVPGQQVQPREGEVFGADHERDEKIPEDPRDGRNQEKEDHHDPVRREDLVVGLGLEDVAGRGQQLQADERGCEPADREEHRDADQVQDRDPLVVCRQEPRPHAVLRVQVVDAFLARCVRVAHGFWDFLSGAGVGAAAGTPAAAGAGDRDLMYAVSWRSPSSLIRPW